MLSAGGAVLNLLFVKTSSLGDVVHQMPAVTDASRRFPDAHISWLVEEAFAPLVHMHPAVAEVVPVATRRWRAQMLQPSAWREIAGAIVALREREEDVIIDTQGLLRSALMTRLVSGTRHGYDSQSVREPLAARLYDVTHRVPRELHAVERNRLLTGLALGYQPGNDIDYGLRAAPGQGRGDYAVLLHGTSRPAKEWRESDWIGLGQSLRRAGLRVVLPWGNAREQERCFRLQAAIAGSEVFARQPLDRTAELIAGARLVVGVDTGLLHLAAAYRVPLIGIYLSTDPGLTGPRGAGDIRVVGGKDALASSALDAYPSFANVTALAEELIARR